MNDHFPLTKAGRTGTVLPAAIVIALALAGCAGSQVENTAPRSPTPIASIPVTPSPIPPSGESTGTQIPTSAGTSVVIEIGGREIAGELDDSTTSLSLLAQLPLTLSFSDYGGQEKVARVPAPLDLTSAPAGSDASPLTIGYYVPDQRLILYYDHVGYFDGIVPIGTYEDIAAVTSQTSDFTATLRQAD